MRSDSHPEGRGSKIPQDVFQEDHHGIRQALRLVEQFEGEPKGPAIDDGHSDEGIAAAWPTAPEAKRRCFNARSERTANAAAAGLEPDCVLALFTVCAAPTDVLPLKLLSPT